jgi:anionic cell wall polymer biosynthesis LytR-Cps2A-Psr (LCP) family protein
MVSGFTYETCLEEMKSSFKTNLTDEVLEKLVSQNPSKPTILSLIKSLEVQHENLMQLQVNLNLIRRQMDNP